MRCMTLPRKLLLTIAAATAALAGATAAQAETVLSSEPMPTNVAAWHGTAMWSQLDPATGNYRLVKSVDGGAPTGVPLPERSGGPFDIDLGTNRSGNAYAVYTRDGDIYRMSVATSVETKITKLSSPTMAERDPTIQRGEIAFIRRDHGYDQLRIGDTTSASKGSRFLVKKRSILGAELAIKQVAYQLAGSKLTYAQGSPRYNSTAWAGEQLGAATSSSLDGGDGANSCDDAGVHYCQVTITGPLSFNLKP
jgi:hypothetical protein